MKTFITFVIVAIVFLLVLDIVNPAYDITAKIQVTKPAKTPSLPEVTLVKPTPPIEIYLPLVNNG